MATFFYSDKLCSPRGFIFRLFSSKVYHDGHMMSSFIMEISLIFSHIQSDAYRDGIFKLLLALKVFRKSLLIRGC